MLGKHEVAGPNPAETSSNNMVLVVQLVEHRIVVPVVAGSSPVLHPKLPASLVVERPALTRNVEVRYLGGQPNMEEYSSVLRGLS